MRHYYHDQGMGSILHHYQFVRRYQEHQGHRVGQDRQLGQEVHLGQVVRVDLDHHQFQGCQVDRPVRELLYKGGLEIFINNFSI